VTSLVFTNMKQNNIWYKNTLICVSTIERMSQSRYVVRVLGIPTSFTKDTFAQELTKQQVVYKSVWLAMSSDGLGLCAGFAFVEFSNEDDMDMFIARYPLTQHKDVLWPSKVDKI